MKSEVPDLVSRLYDLLIQGKKYAERRGAAYGLAGVVKGRGLSALKEFDLIDKLREAAKDKESFMSRQGALLAFESVCRLFILFSILKAFAHLSRGLPLI